LNAAKVAGLIPTWERNYSLVLNLEPYPAALQMCATDQERFLEKLRNY
jgi:hypothetical protein